MSLSHRATTATIAALLALAPIAAQPVLAVTMAGDDAYAIEEDTQLDLGDLDNPRPNLLANDTNDGGMACVASYDATGLTGTIDATSIVNGVFIYTPPPDWNGETTFTYVLGAIPADVCIATPDATATVTISVTPVNDPPTAFADSFSGLAGHTLNVAAPGVLANDSDIDGNSLTAIKVNSPAHGVLTLGADGGFSYTPASGYTGPDAFSYQASDGSAQSATRIVSLSVSTIPPTPTPTPQPTPTPAPPTASPEPSPSESPLPSDSGLASPSPFDTGLLASGSPSPSPGTSPTSGQGGGLPLLAVGALVLLIGLLAVAGVFFVRSQRSEGDEAIETGAFEDDEPED